jgi:hypothetical protein
MDFGYGYGSSSSLARLTLLLGRDRPCCHQRLCRWDLQWVGVQSSLSIALGVEVVLFINYAYVGVVILDVISKSFSN